MGVLMESSSGRREARVSDLSTGGCFVDSIAQVRVGEIIRFKLSLSEDRTEDLTGKVAYILDTFGFGIKFIDLSAEQEARIGEIVIAHGGKP